MIKKLEDVRISIHGVSAQNVCDLVAATMPLEGLVLQLDHNYRGDFARSLQLTKSMAETVVDIKEYENCCLVDAVYNFVINTGVTCCGIAVAYTPACVQELLAFLGPPLPLTTVLKFIAKQLIKLGVSTVLAPKIAIFLLVFLCHSAIMVIYYHSNVQMVFLTQAMVLGAMIADPAAVPNQDVPALDPINHVNPVDPEAQIA